MQWGIEYPPFEFRKHLNVWSSDFKWFGIQMGYYVLDWPFNYRTSNKKQYYVHLSGIQMVGLSGIQMAFENQTIWHPTSFLDHLNTRLVQYSDPHCNLKDAPSLISKQETITPSWTSECVIPYGSLYKAFKSWTINCLPLLKS